MHERGSWRIVEAPKMAYSTRAYSAAHTYRIGSCASERSHA